MSEPADDLPESVAIAWGLRERPGKGPKRSLSLEQVVTAAVKVADTDGLAAVSMSRVATELGVATMSLYRYVSTKNELVELMVDAAFGDPPPPREPDEGWRTALARWADGNVAALHHRPWLRHVRISGPPIHPNSVRWMEQGLACLRDTALHPAERLSTVLLVSGYARYWATLTGDLTEAAAGSGDGPDEAGTRYWQHLERLTRAGGFPAIRDLLAAPAGEDEDDDFEAEWRFGLDRLLDGVEVLIRSRR
ncbi:TetR/AcrR family transcriptional regulator [Micromonospora sp. NPDC126480]|uniref:TetR/AcrR family transcriptional regulator n=1 Tax=Micromonospora sp. NPDC126480 TaxID=3155312 RepID=UPI003317F91D